MNRITHCPQGHDYDEKNTYYYRGSRYCRRCLSDRCNRNRRRKTVRKRLIRELGEELGLKTYEELKGKIR